MGPRSHEAALRRSRKLKGCDMSKTKTGEFSDTVEFPSFDASKAAEQFRAFTEKGLEQSKEAYAKLKDGAEEAQKALEATFETARSVSSDLSRSEEHTSELQSRENLVCRLLLEKKKQKKSSVET